MAIVRCSAWARRQRSIAAWLPLSSTSGTTQPRNVAGRVYCGSSSRPRIAEALRDGAGVVAHRSRQQPGHRVDDEARGRLAAGQHDVADAELAVDEVLADAVVDALVTAAQQREPLAFGELGGDALIEPATAGTEQQQRADRVDRLDGGEDRLGLHQHAGAAAERGVVDRAVHVGGVLADVVAAKVEDTGLAGLAQQARRAEGVDGRREDREDVDAHHPSVLVVEQSDRWIDDDRPGPALGDEDDRHEGAGVELEQVGRRVGDDGDAAATPPPGRLDDLGADQLVDEQARRGRRAARRTPGRW